MTNTGDDGRSSGQSNNRGGRSRGRKFSKSKKRNNRSRFHKNRRDDKPPYKAKSSRRRNNPAARRGNNRNQQGQGDQSKIYQGNDGYGSVNGTRPNAPSAPRRSFDEDGRPDKFELFCAFHMGITEKGAYRMQGLNEIARRYGCKPDEIVKFLKDYGIDKETVKASGIDVSLARLDVQVAPEGVDKWEMARPWYDEFVEWEGESPKSEAETNKKTDSKAATNK